MLSWGAARTTAAMAAGVALVLLTPAAALANHEVVCPADGGDCTIVAHNPGSPGTSGGGSSGGGSSGGAAVCSWEGEAVPCHDPVKGWYDGDGCYWNKVDPQPPGGDAAWQGHEPGDGAVYFIACLGAWGSTGGYSGLLWRATSPPGFGGLPNPAQLAAQAINRLPIRGPIIGIAPKSGSGGAGAVGLPIWMWTPVSPQTWGPASATASVPGLSVTATARAQKIVWSMGNGDEVTCTTPGTPYKPSYGDRKSPDCGYHEDSAHGRRHNGYVRPGRYAIQAVTTWQVTWVGGGQSGAVTVTRQSSTQIDIDELQVVTS